jgi:hypothetical protein
VTSARIVARRWNSMNGSWESLGLKNARIDPRLSDQSVGLSIASRIAGRGLLLNPGLHAYVNLVAAALASASPLYDWDLNVYILQDDESHAYAVPGGYVFLSKGMVAQCRDEAELAALIGHEIGVMITSFAIQEPTERSTMNAIDDRDRPPGAVMTRAEGGDDLVGRSRRLRDNLHLRQPVGEERAAAARLHGGAPGAPRRLLASVAFNLRPGER